MPGILDEIVDNKRAEIAERKTLRSQSAFTANLQAGDGSFLSSLSSPGLKLITEVKPSSPSAGTLREHVNIDEVLSSYNRYASAISVLTDKKYFGGSLELLGQIAKQSPHPVLCKDFIIDACQVYEARAFGAQAVLLIAKILSDDQLKELHNVTTELKMTAVVEVQTEDELSRALVVSPQVLLINNRNLTTFEIDLETTRRLTPHIPPSAIAVSASGIRDRQDIKSLLPCCTRFLIGSTLMRSSDIDSKLRELCGK